MHGSSSNLFWTFVRFERSLRLSDLDLVLLIKNVFVLLSKIKIVNSLELLLLLNHFDFVLHVFALSVFFFFCQFLNKLFCLYLLRKKSWVVDFCSSSFLAILFHGFLNSSLILNSFLILLIFNDLLLLLRRKEIFLEMFFKDFCLFVVRSSQSSLVSLILDVFSPNIFRDLWYLISMNDSAFILIEIRVWVFLNLSLTNSMRKFDWFSKSFTLSRWDTISKLWRHRSRRLSICYIVLSLLRRICMLRLLLLLSFYFSFTFFSSSLPYHLVDYLLFSSFFVFLDDFFLNSFSIILFKCLLILFLLIKVKVPWLEPSLIIDYILLNNLVLPYSLFAYSCFFIPRKVSLLNYFIVVKSSLRCHLLLDLPRSWSVQSISGVQRRLTLGPMTLVQVNLLAFFPFLEIGVHLRPIIQKYRLNMKGVLNSVLHVLLILALKSLGIPFGIRIKQPCIRVIVLVGSNIVALCWMGIRRSSLQETYAWVLFIVIFLILIWIELTILNT